jgi:hypothetical protein
LRHLGISRAAVYSLSSETTLYDEIKFNQFHNGTDVDNGDDTFMMRGAIKVPFDAETAQRKFAGRGKDFLTCRNF